MTTDIQDGVLYGLLSYGPGCWYAHGARLEPGMFDGDRREIFEAVSKLNRAGQAVDAVMVAEALGGGEAEEAIPACLNAYVSKTGMRSYCDHLRRAYAVSRAKDIGAELMDTGDVELAKSALLALDGIEVSETVTADQALKSTMADIEHRTTSEGGLRTGLADLDRVLCGLEPSDFCVIAARPSMGKTALMLNIALRCGVPVGIFSLEMSTEQLTTRLIASSGAGVHYGRLRWPRSLTDDDWTKITPSTQQIQKSGLMINDGGGQPIGRIEAEAYRMVKGHGVRLICVDYLQLVTCKAENRLESVSEVSRRLKGLAKNLKVPVIGVSQMNRAIEKRGNPRPIMSYLRETGQIEQDADQIIFIHRPEVFVPGQRVGEADLIIAKNRGGETADVTVGWQGVYQRFVNLQRGYPQEAA